MPKFHAAGHAMANLLNNADRGHWSAARFQPLHLAIQVLIASTAASAAWAQAPAAAAIDSAASAGIAVRSYHIAAGPLLAALRQVAQEAGVSLQLDGDIASSAQTPGVHGSYDVKQALQALAAPAGLQVSQESNSRFAVHRSDSRALSDVVVAAKREVHTAGASTTLTQEDLAKAGANNFGDIMRYETLVAAPGVGSGSSRNKSSLDRGGYTGYNIRGIEANRIGLDVDGIPLPEATGRPYVSRAGQDSFGIGRDYIDPEMFAGVDISSGTTNPRSMSSGIGGSVGFRTKSPEDYVSAAKPTYFGYKSSYDSANRGWGNSVTAAGQSGDFNGLLVYSRRDAHETRNNSEITPPPESWHSDALLLKGGWQPDAENKVSISLDHYRRSNQVQFNSWNSAGTAFASTSRQHGDTERTGLQLSHRWTPLQGPVDVLETRVFYQDTATSDITRTTPIPSGATTLAESDYQTRSMGFSSVAEKRMDNHRLALGVNASLMRSERPWVNSGLMRPTPDTDATRLALFIEDEISFQIGGRRLAVVPNLRVEKAKTEALHLENFVGGSLTLEDAKKYYGRNNRNTNITPSLSVLYDLQPRLTAYAQYKRGARSPSTDELYGSWNVDKGYAGSGAQYALIGNPDLRKESSDAFDFGVKGEPVPGVNLRSSVFYTRYKDFIGYTRYTRATRPDLFVDIPAHIGTIYQSENRDQASIYGVELSARLSHGEWSPALKGLNTFYALGYSRGSSKSAYAGDKKVSLDTVLPAKAVVGASFDSPDKRFGVTMSGTFVRAKQAVATNRQSFNNNPGSSLPDATVQLMRVPGYATFDLFAYWQLQRHVRLSAGIYNLTNKQYWDYASVRSLQPAVATDRYDAQVLTRPGRTAMVTLNVAY